MEISIPTPIKIILFTYMKTELRMACQWSCVVRDFDSYRATIDSNFEPSNHRVNLLIIFTSMGFVAHSLPNFAAAESSLGVPFGPIKTQLFATGIPLFDQVSFRFFFKPDTESHEITYNPGQRYNEHGRFISVLHLILLVCA